MTIPSGNAPEPVVDAGPGIGEEIGPGIRRYNLDLSTARNQEKISLGGRMLWCANSQGTSALADIQFNEPTEGGTPFLRGTMMAGIPFHSIFVSNTAQAGASLTLIAFTRIITIINPSAVASLVEILLPNSRAFPSPVTVSGTSGSPTLLMAANANLKNAIIYADPANTESVTLTESASGSVGFPLVAGAAMSITGSSAVYGFRASANQTIYVAQELNV